MWYGVCNNARSLQQYCVTNETARPLDDEGRKLLTVFCGHLDGLPTCCDNEQVRIQFIRNTCMIHPQ